MGKHSPLKRTAIDALDLYCRKANAPTLKRLALALGATLGPNKSTIRQNILSQVEPLEELKERKGVNGVISVLGIDAGVSNFAFAKFKWSSDEDQPTLLDWQKFSLNEKFLSHRARDMSLHPEDTSQVLYELTQYLTSGDDLPDLFTIERQRARSMSSSNVLEPVLKVNVLEQILFSNLRNKVRFTPKSKLDYLVASSDPQRMTSYWCSLTPTRTVLSNKFPKGSEETSLKMSSTRLTKSIKINLVKRILEGALGFGEKKIINLTPYWDQRLRGLITSDSKFKLWECVGLGPDSGVKKDDDLADSFLHGLAWMQWLRAYEEVYEIIMKSGGGYDQNILAEFNNYCKNKKFDLADYQKGTSDRLECLEE